MFGAMSGGAQVQRGSNLRLVERSSAEAISRAMSETLGGIDLARLPPPIFRTPVVSARRDMPPPVVGGSGTGTPLSYGAPSTMPRSIDPNGPFSVASNVLGTTYPVEQRPLRPTQLTFVPSTRGLVVSPLHQTPMIPPQIEESGLRPNIAQPMVYDITRPHLLRGLTVNSTPIAHRTESQLAVQSQGLSHPDASASLPQIQARLRELDANGTLGRKTTTVDMLKSWLRVLVERGVQGIKLNSKKDELLARLRWFAVYGQ
jgi:hypothetical protein